MKTLLLVIFALFFSIPSYATDCVDWMKPMAQSTLLQRGGIVGELVFKKGIVAKEGSTEITLVDGSGNHVTVRFHQKLTADLVLEDKAQMRMLAVSDREDNQNTAMNCGSNSALCLHVDHPLVDTITFSNEKIGNKQLNEAGLAVCNI